MTTYLARFYRHDRLIHAQRDTLENITILCKSLCLNNGNRGRVEIEDCNQRVVAGMLPDGRIGWYDAPEVKASRLTEARCLTCGDKIVRDPFDRWMHDNPNETFFVWTEHEAEPSQGDVVLRLPRESWDFLKETLEVDAESGSFGRVLRERIKAALATVKEG